MYQDGAGITPRFRMMNRVTSDNFEHRASGDDRQSIDGPCIIFTHASTTSICDYSEYRACFRRLLEKISVTAEISKEAGFIIVLFKLWKIQKIICKSSIAACIHFYLRTKITDSCRLVPEQEKEKAARLAKYEKDLGNDPKRLKAAIDYYLASYQTDQQRRQDQVSKAHTNKLSELKRFSDELEKTTREGLLDSAAVIRVKYYSQPIFETDSQKGHMLVIENPEYIRKDLPVYVPQILVVYWRYNNWAPQEEIDKIIERDFPFEKLEGMIDR